MIDFTDSIRVREFSSAKLADFEKKKKKHKYCIRSWTECVRI